MKSFDLVQIKSTAKSADFPHFFEGDFRWVFVHGIRATLIFVQTAHARPTRAVVNAQRRPDVCGQQFAGIPIGVSAIVRGVTFQRLPL